MNGWFGTYDVDPKCFFPCPFSPSVARAPWIIEAHLYPRSEAEMYWPVITELTSPSSDARVDRILNFSNRESTVRDEMLKQSVLFVMRVRE